MDRCILPDMLFLRRHYICIKRQSSESDRLVSLSSVTQGRHLNRCAHFKLIVVKPLLAGAGRRAVLLVSDAMLKLASDS